MRLVDTRAETSGEYPFAISIMLIENLQREFHAAKPPCPAPRWETITSVLTQLLDQTLRVQTGSQTGPLGVSPASRPIWLWPGWLWPGWLWPGCAMPEQAIGEVTYRVAAKEVDSLLLCNEFLEALQRREPITLNAKLSRRVFLDECRV